MKPIKTYANELIPSVIHYTPKEETQTAIFAIFTQKKREDLKAVMESLGVITTENVLTIKF